MSNLASNTPSLQSILDTVNALPEKVDTSGTATAADIYTGKTATVNDVKFTGTNPWNDANVTPYVTEALAALAEHGVDSTGKGLADLAALIAAIEVGGGGTKITSGTFTIGEDITSDIVIEHGLGEKPTYWITYCTTSKNFTASGFDGLRFAIIAPYSSTSFGGVWAHGAIKYQTGKLPNTTALGYYFSMDDSTLTYRQTNLSSTLGLVTGNTYRWFSIGEV